MGVHGLTTFLRENKRVLSRTRTFTNSFNEYTPLVVDGWSLIYILYADSGLPWAYGGEYDSFAKFVQGIVNAWLSVGLEPYFVFDGPVPLAKITTTIKRLAEVVHTTNIFFRTSAGARSTPSFLSTNRIIPPLLFETCIDALHELDSERVHIVMADGEADPTCVALAGALGGGLVVAIDSDFAVLNVEGYGGYTPTDEMVWQSSGGEESTPLQSTQDLDGFQTITIKPRTKRKSSGLVPPPCISSQELSLTVSIYHPHTLATHLQLPSALLPLFSALVGNDFSNPTHARKFFENRSTVVEKIWKVARAVSGAVKQGQGQGEGKAQGRGDAVLDVIHSAVMKLLVRPDLTASGEVDKIVDETIDAALECTIAPIDTPNHPISLSSESCPLHQQDECPLGTVSSKFLQAYRVGDLSPRLMNAATTGIVLPKVFLEDPDQRSCANVTNGTWSQIWAVLAAGGHVQVPSDSADVAALLSPTTGLKSPLTDLKSPLAGLKSPLGGLKSPQDTDSRLDDSELISVVEEFTATEPSVYSDGGLASELAERLKSLAGSFDDFDSNTDRVEGEHQHEHERTLVQYARKGLKLIPEPVGIGLGKLGSLEDWTKADWIKVFLEGTKSFTPALKSAFETSSLDMGTLLWICVLRNTVQGSAELGVSGSSSPAVVGKWKKAEARAFISALSTTNTLPINAEDLPALDVRTIQRVGQLLHSFDACARLAEATYIFDGHGQGRNVVGQAVRMFSGRIVHSSTSSSEVNEDVWALVCDGIEEGVWAYEQSPKKAKVKPKDKNKTKGNVKSSGFGVLALLDTE